MKDVLVARSLVLGGFLAVALSAAGCSSSDSSPTPAADAGASDADTNTDIDAGNEPDDTEDASTADQQSPDDDASAGCSAAIDQLLAPVDKVSEGAVTTLSDENGTRTIFVDGTAGGAAASASNPRVYLNLETGARVDVTDVAARTETTWDLAIKRPVLFTNGGQVGSGSGGAVLVAKDFADVTAADAESATFVTEEIVDAECAPKVDQTGAMRTSFDAWYDYDGATHHLTPHAGTWLVKGATGKLYKIQILSYYANPDGSEGEAGGRYKLAIGAL